MKVAQIGSRGCILEVLFDYLTNWKHFVKVKKVCSHKKDVSSEVTQGSLLGSSLFLYIH